MNKRGDIATIIYVVIFIAVVGIVFFFVSHLNQEIYTQLDDSLNISYAGSESVNVLQDIKSQDQSIWDYAFLGIFMGCLLAIGLTAWSVRISPVFFWIYVILGLFVLGLGVVLSNVWQELAANPTFTTTLTHFPITNTLLGSYFPIVITGVIILALGFIFGKPPQE